MTIRYFTVEEANAHLPELSPLVDRLLELRAHVSVESRDMGAMLADIHSDVGGLDASKMAVEFIEMEALVERIQSYGCVLKSIESGLLDFLCERDGRDVYLCWRFGEPSIQFYHEVHKGFQDRKVI